MPQIRNIAIIAHVDHGKTTLVDAMLHQSGVFRENQVVVTRVMDSNDLERERGITILAKNTALFYHDTKINIVDTPGHRDFVAEADTALEKGDPNGVLQAQVMNLDYSDFLGRIAIGRVFNGTLRRGSDVGIAKRSGVIEPTRITKLYTFRGLERDEAEEVACGDLVAVAGVEGIQIGGSLTDIGNPQPLDPLGSDEPTPAQNFTIKTIPPCAREG